MFDEVKKMNIFFLNKKWGVLPMAIFLFVAFILLSSVYITLANDITEGNYQIQNLNNNLEKLKEQNEELRIDIADVQANSNIEKRIESLQMVNAGNIEFINLTNSSVAQK